MKQKLAFTAVAVSAAITMSGKIDINLMPQTVVYERPAVQRQNYKTLCDRTREFNDRGKHVCEYKCREGDQKTLYMTYYSSSMQCRDVVETEIKR
jgi:hypothetical protein